MAALFRLRFREKKRASRGEQRGAAQHKDGVPRRARGLRPWRLVALLVVATQREREKRAARERAMKEATSNLNTAGCRSCGRLDSQPLEECHDAMNRKRGKTKEERKRG
jgi:hypothetical protein